MSTIEVGSLYQTLKDVTDGNNVHIEWFNAGEKEIKYLTFTLIPYNRVNDIVSCTVRGGTEHNVRLTGPISPKYKDYSTWEDVWYNKTIHHLVITQIHIMYMDNTEEIIDGKDIVSMKDKKSVYYREVQRISDIKTARRKLEYDCKYHNYGDTELKLEERFRRCFDDDEKAVLEVINGFKAENLHGYKIGDYLEKEYFSNEEIMKIAIQFWKDSVSDQQKSHHNNTEFAKKHRDYPQKYAEKIKKYDPSYIMPKKDVWNSLKSWIAKI